MFLLFFVVGIIIVSFSFASIFGSMPAKASGKDVFLKYKCDTCHEVSTAGIIPKTKSKAPDLVNVTVRHEKKWIRGFIKQSEVHVSCPKVEKSQDGKLHPIKFKGDKKEEDLLIEWLDQQRE